MICIENQRPAQIVRSLALIYHKHYYNELYSIHSAYRYFKNWTMIYEIVVSYLT